VETHLYVYRYTNRALEIYRIVTRVKLHYIIKKRKTREVL